MKNILFILIALLLFSFVSVTAQTNTWSKMFNAQGLQSGEVLYYNVTMSADSAGNYYSKWYNTANLLGNELESDLELTMAIIHASVLGSSVITTTMQGRYTGGATSDAFQVDAVDATDSTETIQLFKVTLDGYKPEWIRMKFDGLTGNYDDTILSAWLTIIF